MAVADVAGKSIPAAMLMATFQASLKTLSAVPCSLPDLVAGMNHYACTNSQSGLRFTTAFLAEFSSTSKNLTYINAGHNAPILQHRSGSIDRLSTGGVPLGILPHGEYQSGNIVLESGDCLVIFTDGLVEAVNELEEEYGEQRLLNLLQLGVASTPDELLRRMMSHVDIFVGPTPQHDDITCMVVKVA
jgi:sigma-B regulation protein RsbU (phosphoserine phosphatase)